VLEEMRIRSLGVIADAVLELGPGLTVVTGETGAGKTMVVTGLGLLLGERADAGVVRSGAGSAVVEGRFAVPADGGVAGRAVEAGADLDDGSLIVARSVAAGGRSRAHLGGRSVPVGVLSEIADDLVAVHGQSEQVLLRSASRQREVVDRYAGEAVAGPLAAFSEAYRRRQQVRAQLDEITTRARERAQEADLLRLGLDEVAAVEPQPGEDAALLAEWQRLSHAEDLQVAASRAHAALLGDPLLPEPGPDAAGLVDAARRLLDRVRAHDADLARLADRLAEVGYLVADVATELSGYAESVEADPARLAAVEERRAALAALTRKYGEDVDAVLAWAQRAAVRLAELEGDDERGAGLRAELADLEGRLADLADQLHQVRTAAGERLAKAVSVELTELAMPHARLTVDVRRRDELGPQGADEVTLLLAPHAGAEPRPLARGASGGELSRVMLALEVVLAGSDPVPTFVFDEVDQGVGGRAAVEIGRRLARLSRSSQVLVVTHLPQVAAFADRHLVVAKEDDGQVTESGVVRLDEAGRVRELARMLAGQAESGSARAHAEELLELAASEGRPKARRKVAADRR
jgi:DNA repair protein RecN (Recombination protein N)